MGHLPSGFNVGGVVRAADEPHRAATPLELFFDLCFVVAVAQAAAQLHHDVADDRIGHAVPSYLMVFFAIWWAWMNFTWFASAYDTDDDVYRLTTLVQVAGALVLAAGVPRAFGDADFTIITIGYVIMRLAMVAQWLRVARTDVHPGRRACGRRYAIGITLVQVGWVLRLMLPDELLVPGLVVLVLAELAVPIWAERVAETTWHPEHIAERYGLFTIIVLGESVLAASIAVQAALDSGERFATLAPIIIGGLLIICAMWWLYFYRPAHDLLRHGDLRRVFAWGYGHFAIFTAAAAVGAGLSVAVDVASHHAAIGPFGAGMAVAVPVAIYVIALWVVHYRPSTLVHIAVGPAAAVIILSTPFAGLAAIPLIGVTLSLLLWLKIARLEAELGSREHA